MKLTLVFEDNASMHGEEGVKAYPERMGAYVAELYKKNGYEVTLIINDEHSDGSQITDEIIAQTDVMIWWGHWYHDNIRDEIANKIRLAVNGGMGFVALHSAHHSKPFKALMGTTCNLSWREIGERERLWVIDHAHPIAQGVPESVVIPHEEMYGEPFEIPTPDELVMAGWFQGGEIMRSCAVWKRVNGKVVFFQPGHETNPTYRIPAIQKILLNVAEYAKPLKKIGKRVNHKPQPPEGDIKITDWE
ncbi:MAG: trehalose utilization protein ThuA [Clostridiales bacterium]|nr:trehalose utilization protein ThuA [Clostridiales bacterium]